MSDAWIQWVVAPCVLALIGAAAEIGRRLMKRLDAITHQVKNDHDTNLRQDVDEIRDGQKVLIEAVASLATDLRTHLKHSESEEAELWRAIGRR